MKALQSMKIFLMFIMEEKRQMSISFYFYIMLINYCSDSSTHEQHFSVSVDWGERTPYPKGRHHVFLELKWLVKWQKYFHSSSIIIFKWNTDCPVLYIIIKGLFFASGLLVTQNETFGQTGRLLLTFSIIFILIL